MNLLEEVALVLGEAGYSLRPTQLDRPCLYFEDTSLIGVCASFESVTSLLSHWRRVQEQFVASNVGRFRRGSLKAWNLYTVLLCQDDLRNGDEGLLAIEEDFSVSRKLVATGVQVTEDVRRALYPLIPVQTRVQFEVQDARARLFDRLELPAGAKSVLTQRQSAEHYLDSLLREL